MKNSAKLLARLLQHIAYFSYSSATVRRKTSSSSTALLTTGLEVIFVQRIFVLAGQTKVLIPCFVC